MRFVIFSRKKVARGRQRTSGPDFWVGVASRCVLQLKLNLESRSSTNVQYCCSFKNYRGKGMEGGEKKVSLRRFLADQKIASS